MKNEYIFLYNKMLYGNKERFIINKFKNLKNLKENLNFNRNFLMFCREFDLS